MGCEYLSLLAVDLCRSNKSHAGPRVKMRSAIVGMLAEMTIGSTQPTNSHSDLMRWAAASGIAGTEHVVVSEGAGGLSLRAASSFAPADEILTVPANLSMSSRRIAQLQLSHLARSTSLGAAATPLWLVASALLEAEHDPAWAPFVGALRDQYVDLPGWWFAFPAAYSKTTRFFNSSAALGPLAAALAELGTWLRRHHVSIAAAYADAPPHHLASICDPRRFARAALHVLSRGFFPASERSGAEGQGKAGSTDAECHPLLDLLNHPDSASANVRVGHAPWWRQPVSQLEYPWTSEHAHARTRRTRTLHSARCTRHAARCTCFLCPAARCGTPGACLSTARNVDYDHATVRSQAGAEPTTTVTAIAHIEAGAELSLACEAPHRPSRPDQEPALCIAAHFW